MGEWGRAARWWSCALLNEARPNGQPSTGVDGNTVRELGSVLAQWVGPLLYGTPHLYILIILNCSVCAIR